MASYRILMVEDEDADAQALASLMDRYAAERAVTLARTVLTSAFSLADVASDYDVIFLDIELPGINGMEAAEELRERGVETPLVFVTNLAQYALHGYAVDAIDFLVKPPTYGSVSMTLDRALRAAERRRSASVVVRGRGEIAVIDRRDLVFVEVSGHDLLYHEHGRTEPVAATGSLAAVERELAEAPFVRVSASHLVNMEHIRRVRRDSVLMDDGTEVWFSRRKHRAAMERITEFLGRTV